MLVLSSLLTLCWLILCFLSVDPLRVRLKSELTTLKDESTMFFSVYRKRRKWPIVKKIRVFWLFQSYIRHLI